MNHVKKSKSFFCKFIFDINNFQIIKSLGSDGFGYAYSVKKNKE